MYIMNAITKKMNLKLYELFYCFFIFDNIYTSKDFISFLLFLALTILTKKNTIEIFKL